MHKKKELEHFYVGDSFGGDQDWFTNIWMKQGGCGAVTACDCCIDLAKTHGLHGLYPFSTEEIQKQEYLEFADRMRPFLHPRWTGIDTLDAFMKGFRQYLETVGAQEQLTMTGFSGNESYEKAVAFIKEKLDADIPIPCLILKHQNPMMKEYYWHWFLLVGYEEYEDPFMVKTATYGEWEWLPFDVMWNPGKTRRGGLVSLEVHR